MRRLIVAQVLPYPCTQSNISFGKFGSFNSEQIIGQPYGLTYDIVGKELKVQPPKAMDELG